MIRQKKCHLDWNRQNFNGKKLQKKQKIVLLYLNSQNDTLGIMKIRFYKVWYVLSRKPLLNSRGFQRQNMACKYQVILLLAVLYSFRFLHSNYFVQLALYFSNALDLIGTSKNT